MYTRLLATWRRTAAVAGFKASRQRARLRSWCSEHPRVEKLEERALLAASLLQTIDTSQFSPPSPDPAGVVYLPGNDTLLIADSEVNEMPLFVGDNLFESTLTGSLVSSSTTLPFSDEPTGATLNLSNGHLFISDDTAPKRIYEVDPAGDGLYGTADDVVTSFSTSDFGSSDPEGVAYDHLQDRLFMVDGVQDMVFEISPGNNGVFDGVAPAGDDQVTSFDVAAFGLNDPEGIAFYPDNGHLYLVGDPEETVFEVTTEGMVVKLIDISAASAKKPSGLAIAPASGDPNQLSLYITDRQVDNGSDPNENDGLIYEFSFEPSPPGSLTTCDVSARDAYIYENHPNDNFGSDDDLRVKPNSGKRRHSLIQFDMAGVPAFSNVSDATLMLYQHRAQENQTVFVHRAVADWVESDVTWNDRDSSTPWSTAGGDFDATVIDSFAPDVEGLYREIDVTSVVQEWVNGTTANQGLLLRSTGDDGDARFKSRDGEDSDKHPQLCVTYHVSTENQAPLVNAGADQSISVTGFPANVALDATVADDGLPDPPAALTTQWSQVSGPPVTFADPTSVDTTVSITTAGTYVLRLTADDGELVSSSDTTIVVQQVDAVIITESGGSTDVTEGGIVDTYAVVLYAQPQSNVTIDLTADSQTTLSSSALTFTPGDWNVAQTVTVTAVDDAVVEGQHSSTIAHTISSQDPSFDGAAVDSVLVNITDNDSGTQTIQVPQDQPTIQAGIDAAQDGDIVLVAPGTYAEQLTLQNKSVTLASQFYTTGDPSFIAQTTINAGGGAAITVLPSVGAGTQIIGFTVQGLDDGIHADAVVDVVNNHFIGLRDAIRFDGGGGTVLDNIVEGNSDDAIDLNGSTAVTIQNNIIRNNSDNGIEIRLDDYSGAALNVVIRDNQITGNGQDGIQLVDEAGNSDRFFQIERNLIQGNAAAGIGLMDNGETLEDFRGASLTDPIRVLHNTLVDNPYAVSGGDNMVVLNNLIVNSSGVGLSQVDGSSIASYNLFWNNGVDHSGSIVDTTTSVFGDPLLTNEYQLQVGSPAIDAGTAFFQWNSEVVLDPPASSYSGTAPDLGMDELENLIALLYFSYNITTTLPGGLSVANEDIISFDGTNYGMVFDGSDLGLDEEKLDAIKFLDEDEILMSFTSSATLPGIPGTVDDSDIVKFTATQLGDNTAGTFEMYFNGSNVGLDTSAEDVDAIDLLDDGRLLISTTGSFSVGQLTFQGEDILTFTPTSLGDTTSGSWSLYLDGSDIGLDEAGLDGVSVTQDGDLYLTTSSRFDVPGLSGRDEDVFLFYPSSLGDNTTGSYDPELFFDGGKQAAGGDLKAIDIVQVQLNTPPPIEFRALSNVPYTQQEVSSLSADLVDVDSGDQFFVHLGDITSDGSPCSESVYSSIAGILQTSSIPAFIVPGDNEWNECADPNQAWGYWDAHLMRLEDNWPHDFNVIRQTVREENFAFVESGVLFIGINLVDGTVHDPVEWSQRMTDDANWVSENFTNFGSQVTSAVVFGHAYADPSGGDLQQFGQDFETLAQGFGKQTLYITGHDGNWTLDHPFDNAPNVTRVVVNSGVPSVRVKVTHNPANPFTFDQSTLVLQSTAAPPLEAETLEDEQLVAIIEQAARQLTHLEDSGAAELLAGLDFQVVDLPGNLLGRSLGSTIQIDDDGAQFGWYVDPVPTDQVEFTYDSDSGQWIAPADSAASGRVDLLTAVMHEIGHVLGFDHADANGLMGDGLPLGTRRLPGASMGFGEVPSWQNRLLAGDVNNDGAVTAVDALTIINELDRREYSEAASSILYDPDSVDHWPAIYFDQNGDNRVTANDALRVINRLVVQVSAQDSSEVQEVGLTARASGQQESPQLTHPDNPELHSVPDTLTVNADSDRAAPTASPTPTASSQSESGNAEASLLAVDHMMSEESFFEWLAG